MASIEEVEPEAAGTGDDEDAGEAGKSTSDEAGSNKGDEADGGQKEADEDAKKAKSKSWGSWLMRRKSESEGGEEKAALEVPPVGPPKNAADPSEATTEEQRASRLSRWSSWMAVTASKAAVTAGSAAGRAVAISRTAAGGARSMAGIAYRTGSGAYQHVSKSLYAARYNDYQTSLLRLEHYAAEMPAEDRVFALKRWVGVLAKLQAEPINERGKAKVTERAAEEEGKDEAESGGSIEAGDGDSGKLEPDGMDEDLLTKAHEVLFYGEEVSPEPMNFRGLFLRSSALEKIVSNFMETPPTDEEADLLLQLFDLTMTGSSQQHKALVDGIVQFSEVIQEHVELSVPRGKLPALLVDAIGKLKARPELEELDEKLRTAGAELERRFELHEDKGTGTAEAAMSAILTAIEGLGSLERRGGVLAELLRTEEALEEVVEVMEGLQAGVGQGQEAVEVELADSKLKKLEGDTYRATKLKDIQQEVNTVAMGLARLHERRAELQAELAQVEGSIAKATARERQLDEERLTFEESSTEVLEHLRATMAGLEGKAAGFAVEGALVRRGLGVMDNVFKVDGAARGEAQSAQSAFEEQTERNFLRACTWHAKCSLAALKKLLSQLKFCATELEALAKKKAEMIDMGMEMIVKDLTSSQAKLEDKYCQDELEALDVLHHHAVMAAKVEQMRPAAGWRSSIGELMDADLQAVHAEMAAHSTTFHAMPRPDSATPAVPSGVPPTVAEIPVQTEPAQPADISISGETSPRPAPQGTLSAEQQDEAAEMAEADEWLAAGGASGAADASEREEEEEEKEEERATIAEMKDGDDVGSGGATDAREAGEGKDKGGKKKKKTKKKKEKMAVAEEKGEVGVGEEIGPEVSGSLGKVEAEAAEDV